MIEKELKERIKSIKRLKLGKPDVDRISVA